MPTIRCLLIWLVACWGIPAIAQTDTPPRAVVTVAMMADNPPFTYPSPKDHSKQTGLLIEILDEVFKLVGQPYAVEVYPWARAQATVQAGQADVLITVPTPERLVYAVASDGPVYLMVMQIYARKDHPRLADIRRIKSAQDIVALDLVAVSNLGNGWHKATIEAAGVKTHYGTSDESAARMLAAKRGDLIVDSAVSMAAEIRRLGLQNTLTATGAPFQPVRFHVLMSNKSTFLPRLPEINRAIQTLQKNGTLERLSQKYTNLE